MSANRVQHHVAWDHSVLTRTAPRLEARNPRPRPTTTEQTGHPAVTIVLAWALIVWSAIAAWGLWTSVNAEAHISMRFLMRGAFEEVLGVLTGLLWACIPAWTAFFLARRVRLATMDDLGARAYWTSAIVSLIAALGILRPTWDANAGSRFAGATAWPAESAPESTQTSADDGSFDASYFDGGDLLDPGVAGAPPEVQEVAALADPGTTPAGPPQWSRSRYAAMLRAMELGGAGGAAYATVDTPDSPE